MLNQLTKRTKKDVRRRFAFARSAYKINILKSILKNTTLPRTIRHYAKYKLNKYFKKNASSKTNRFCAYTGNYRSVYQKYHLSRYILKDFAGFGRIIGLYKK